MAEHPLTIPYSDDLLLSLEESPERFQAEARLLLAIELYELGRLSTGRAAALAGMERVEFIFALRRFGVSPVGLLLPAACHPHHRGEGWETSQR